MALANLSAEQHIILPYLLHPLFAILFDLSSSCLCISARALWYTVVSFSGNCFSCFLFCIFLWSPSITAYSNFRQEDPCETKMLIQTQAERQECVAAQSPLVHNWQITLQSPKISSAIAINFCMLFTSCCIWLQKWLRFPQWKIHGTALKNSLG